MNRPLVRFRGMIQSTDQEVYQSVLAGGKLGGWGLAEGQLEDDSSDSNGSEVGLDDRNTAWAVSVPGETDWMASVRSFPCRSAFISAADAPNTGSRWPSPLYVVLNLPDAASLTRSPSERRRSTYLH